MLETEMQPIATSSATRCFAFLEAENPGLYNLDFTTDYLNAIKSKVQV